ncbi:MAG TPA: TerC family protein, partial [Planctomycetota bacterium]|nr:TerC family protein [Planctomycetota bacterium]
MEIQTIGSPAMFGGFTIFVLLMLALDLGVFHRKAHSVSFKEALTWSCVWISLAAVFNVGVYFWFGKTAALEFATCYIIEKALSVDNIFVFLVIFSYFCVPGAYQHRVLFWGILGALIMRAIFIFLGAALLARFHWVIYVFGGFLLLTGLKMLLKSDEEIHPDKNPVYKIFKKFIPMVTEFRGAQFTVIENGKRFATPLLLVLAIVEMTDVIFAVDSIPAVFAVTTDPFIVFTSNIFAILGLRALFFLLAGVMDKFHLLKIGLALVLMFVGAKMLLVEFYKVPITISLSVIGVLIGGSVAASLIWPKP